MPNANAFNPQPTLRGDLIELRPLRREDFEPLYSAASDPLIWEQHPEPDRHTREVFQRYFDGGIACGGALAVIDRSSGRIIGSSRYHDLSPHASQVEIGYSFLIREFWGGRTNGELKRLMIDHAMRYVDRVVFVIGEKNLRSQKAIEKIGATFIQPVERPDHDGKPRKSFVYAITKKAWQAQHRRTPSKDAKRSSAVRAPAPVKRRSP